MTDIWRIEVVDRKKFKELIKNSEKLDEAMDNEYDILLASLNCCTPEIKCLVVVEELAELAQQVSKMARKEVEDVDDIYEEMADVVMCLEMLDLMLGDEDKERFYNSYCAKLYREGVRRGVIKE